MNNITCKLDHFNLHNKRVLLRADLNVPISNKKISDDFRLHALLPTLDYLQKHDAITILVTHLGRPNNHEQELSTKMLLPWFEQHNYKIIFESNISRIATTNYAPQTIVLCENIRFFSGEKNHDKQFAQELASCAEYYVNDAFGTLHRNDTSVTLVADCFPKNKKTIGFLVEKELNELNNLKNNPKHPFVVILGGGKVDTKLKLIKGLMNQASTILLCPAVVFTFLKALKKPVGISLVDDALLNDALEIITLAEQHKVQLYFPLDYQIAHKKIDGTIDGTLEIINAENFPDDGFGISIGPRTVQQWKPIIEQAKTIFLNAAMGFAKRPETLAGLHELLKYIGRSQAYSVIGGGDSVAAVERFGLTNTIDFLSTGGGSTLAYLSGNPLPGLNALMR